MAVRLASLQFCEFFLVDFSPLHNEPAVLHIVFRRVGADERGECVAGIFELYAFEAQRLGRCDKTRDSKIKIRPKGGCNRSVVVL